MIDLIVNAGMLDYLHEGGAGGGGGGGRIPGTTIKLECKHLEYNYKSIGRFDK